MNFNEVIDNVKSSPVLLWGGIAGVLLLVFLYIKSQQQGGTPAAGAGSPLMFGGGTPQSGTDASTQSGTDPVSELSQTLALQLQNAKDMLALDKDAETFKQEQYNTAATTAENLRETGKTFDVQNLLSQVAGLVGLQDTANKNDIANANTAAQNTLSQSATEFAQNLSNQKALTDFLFSPAPAAATLNNQVPHDAPIPAAPKKYTYVQTGFNPFHKVFEKQEVK